METATQNLVNDHVQIIRLIEVMDKIVLQENPNISDIEEVIYLIKNFADVFITQKRKICFSHYLVKRDSLPNRDR